VFQYKQFSRILIQSLGFIFAFILLGYPFSIQAQTQTEEEHQLWFDIYPHYQINEQWEYFGDLGYRTALTADWDRVYFRPSVRYRPNPLYQVHGGIGNFFIFSKDGNRAEFRPWQGFRINWPSTLKFHLQHYFRLEERLSFFSAESSDVIVNSFELRFRYRIKGVWEFYYIDDDESLYMTAYTEIFIPLIDEVDEFFRNTNRTGFGLGYRMLDKYRIEGVYNLQRSRFEPGEDLIVSDYVYQLKFYFYWNRQALKKLRNRKKEDINDL